MGSAGGVGAAQQRVGGKNEEFLRGVDGRRDRLLDHAAVVSGQHDLDVVVVRPAKAGWLGLGSVRGDTRLRAGKGLHMHVGRT